MSRITIYGTTDLADQGLRGEREESRALKAQVDKLRLLFQTASLINATMDPRQVISLVLREAVRIMGATSGSLRMVDEENGFLRLEVAIGKGRNARRALQLKLGEGITGWVALHGQPLLVPDVTKEPRYLPIRKGVKSEMAVPLCMEGKVIGVLNLDSNRLNAFTENDLELLTALANQSARVFHNARLHEQLKKKAMELRSLFSVGQAIVSSLNLDEVLGRITSKVVELMEPVKLCSLMLLDHGKGELVIRAVHGASERYTKKPPLKVTESLLGRVAREKTPLIVQDVRRHPEFRYSRLARREGLVSLLSVPMICQNRVIGVLNAYTGKEHRFSSEEVELLATLANQSAIAIENARLYESVVSAEEKIRQSERLLLLGEIAAEVAHEIRNPLTVIRMLAHSVKETFPPEDPRSKDLLIIEQKIGQMAGLVEQILEMGKQREFDWNPVELHAVAQETLELLRHRLSKQRVKLVTKWGKGVPPVLGDKGQLEQMVLNLLLNACQAMPDGGQLTVRTGTRTRRPEGRLVWIAVEDTGCGIPEGKVEEIFQPFVSFRSGGIGLGLAVVHRIVKQHKGTITVKNIPTGGTRFLVELPAWET